MAVMYISICYIILDAISAKGELCLRGDFIVTPKLASINIIIMNAYIYLQYFLLSVA